MKAGGSRIGIVFNGSPLFTGAAESGETTSESGSLKTTGWGGDRPTDQLFYNTGISTYMDCNQPQKCGRKGKYSSSTPRGEGWRVDERGKLDYNRFWQKDGPSLGNKRKKIGENGNDNQRALAITQLYGNFEENEFVKNIPQCLFGYWRITVEQPLKKMARW